MEFVVDPSSERFDGVDDRWLAQVAVLVADLRRDVGTVERRRDAQPGTKGDLGSIVLALGSAGAFAAAVEVIKAFVDRDRGRTVRLSWHQDGRLESFEVGGQGIDDALLERVVGALELGSERSE